MKINLSSLGWWSHGNCGDEMFKDVLTEIFQAYDLSFYSDLKRNTKYINNSDFLLIGGGNIIDPTFLDGLKEITIPHSFIGVGITEPKNIHLMDQASQIFVRDQRSFDYLSESKKEYYLMPDMAFNLEANQDRGRSILSTFPGINKNKPTIGLFLNDCVNVNFSAPILKFVEFQKVTLELARFLDSLAYNVLFIPMSFIPPDDRRISFTVLGNMKNGYKHNVVVNPLSPQDCLDLTSALDFAFTMRLHAAVFCTIAGVPFIDITHHSKNKSYLETEGLSNLSLDYYELSIRTLRNKFEEINNQHAHWQQKLLVRAEKNHTQLQETLTNVRIP